MIERHSIELAKVCLNVLSDAERRTIILQFHEAESGPKPVRRIWKALRQRFGVGVISRLGRWATGDSNPLVLSSKGERHPENPDVLCFDLDVKDGERMETALAALFDFFREQPGFRRMIGEPLDRDPTPSRIPANSGDISQAAGNTLRKMLKRRNKKHT